MPECPLCHKPVSETARWCESCGASLKTGAPPPEQLIARIRELIAQNKKLEAMQALREATGISLAEARRLVEADAAMPDSSEDPDDVVSGDLDEDDAGDDFEQELLELLRAGKKIEAIKRHRERTNLGLKESKDAVEALAARHGIASTRAGCLSVLLVGLGLLLAAATCVAAGDKTADDWLVHPLTSRNQAAPTEIKVLLPNNLDRQKRYPVLYVLPVEAGNERRYGDGLSEIRRCDLHNRHGLICVAPTFAHLPWYADHPTDRSIRQESYFVNEVVPLVERLYPVRADRDGRWLLGFSKSGWGAWSLLARHPDQFGRAAAWDAPLAMPRFDQYGAGQVFGTQAHFETYRVLPALDKCPGLRDSPPRLVLTGYGNFRDHHATAHQRLDEAKIPHVYRDGPPRKHDWNSGWVAEAVDLLATLKP